MPVSNKSDRTKNQTEQSAGTGTSGAVGGRTGDSQGGAQATEPIDPNAGVRIRSGEIVVRLIWGD